MNETLFLLLYGNTARTFLVMLVVVLSVLDVISTQKAISSGNAKEANPLINWFITRFGLKILPLVKLPIIIAVLTYGIYQANWILMVMSLFLAVVVVNNFRLANSSN